MRRVYTRLYVTSALVALASGRFPVQPVRESRSISRPTLEDMIPAERVERRADRLLHHADPQRPIALVDGPELFPVKLR